MPFLRYSVVLSLIFVYQAHAAEVTPSHVYAQTERVYADVLLIKAHYNLVAQSVSSKLHVKFKPRHVWQKTYEILFKLHVFRQTQGYPSIAVGTLEPLKDIAPKQVYDQIIRMLAELSLIKEELHINIPTPTKKQHSGKVPADVYQLLSNISAEIDVINGQGFTPSHVFSQVIRLNSDIDVILHALNISDQSIPPIKNKQSQPYDAFKAAMQLMQSVNQIQRLLAIESVDFSSLKKENINPEDVYALIGLVSAELQLIKFALSLRHQRTPSDHYYEGKSPADVEQMLGWCYNKLNQISRVNF